MSGGSDEEDRGQFPEPSAPSGTVVAFSHTHKMSILTTARRNANGTFSSLWSCSECPDIFIGGRVGTIPAGHCECGWVQKKWPRKRCEECRRDLTPPGSRGDA